MNHQPVKSTSIRSIAYDAARRTLEIVFATGKRYRFSGVPAKVYTDFLAAESKGRYFGTIIRPVYRATLVS